MVNGIPFLNFHKNTDVGNYSIVPHYTLYFEMYNQLGFYSRDERRKKTDFIYTDDTIMIKLFQRFAQFEYEI